ncbi:MAG: hypothetical protein OXS30_11290 [Chloroflexota bacterium]|nr:hypothetical protein [Chloroflexota bacterium]
MNTRGIDLQRWLMIGLVGAILAGGIWAFGVDKPARIMQVQIALRNVGEQRAELGVLETDHQGVERFYEADGPDLDLSLVDRPRSIYSEPITLSNDTKNAPSQVRITMRGLSDTEVKLGLRGIRPNRTWDSTRFPRTEPITIQELHSEDWLYMSPLPVKVVYHQPLVDIVRLFVYVAGAFAVLIGIGWIIWRRWLS